MRVRHDLAAIDRELDQLGRLRPDLADLIARYTAPDAAQTPSGVTPISAAPSGAAPSGIAPSSAAPSGVAPSSAAPSGVAPSSAAPSGIAPSSVAFVSLDSSADVADAAQVSPQTGQPPAAHPSPPLASQELSEDHEEFELLVSEEDITYFEDEAAEHP